MDGTDRDVRVRVVVHDPWHRDTPALDLLRAELAVVRPGAPDDVGLARRCPSCGGTDHGRPQVADADLDVGIAHSGRLLVLAIAHRTRVGIDVELVRGRSPDRLRRLATRVLGEPAAMRLARIAPLEAERELLRAWTAREAYLKALGIGITRSLRDADPRAAGWHLTEVAGTDPSVVVAVVTEHPAAIELVARDAARR